MYIYILYGSCRTYISLKGCVYFTAPTNTNEYLPDATLRRRRRHADYVEMTTTPNMGSSAGIVGYICVM